MEHVLFNKAIILSTIAHAGQTSANGEPYVLHPLHVMHQGQTLEEQVVGVLHDVIEDSKVTLEDLEEDGFPLEILEALDAITHRYKRNGWEVDETNVEYHIRVKANSLATTVKLRDIRHNLSRIEDLASDPERYERCLQKWKKAWEFLGGYKYD